MNDAPGDYAGFVTRAIALAIDIAVIDLAAVTVAIVIGLGISAFELPDIVVTITITIAVGALVYMRGLHCADPLEPRASVCGSGPRCLFEARLSRKSGVVRRL